MKWLREQLSGLSPAAPEKRNDRVIAGEFKNGELVVVENREFEVGDFSRLEFESKRSEVSIVANPELSKVKLKMTFHSFEKDANAAQEQLDSGKIAARVSQEGSLIKIGTITPETIISLQAGRVEVSGRHNVVSIDSLVVIGNGNVFVSDGEVRIGDKKLDPTGGWVNFEFEVPTKFEGKIATSGDVEISGTNGDLSVDCGSGSLQFKNVSGNEIFAGASRGDLNLSDIEAQKLVASTNSGEIAIEKVIADLRAHSGRGDLSIKNLVGNLEVKANSGEVNVDEVSGIVTIESGRGEIEVGNVSDDLVIDAQSGDVTVSHAGKNLKVDLGRGDLDVAFVQGNLNVVAGSGDIVAGAIHGDFDVKSGRGDVTLREVSGTGNVKSRSGEIKVRGFLKGDSSFSTDRGDISYVSVAESNLQVVMSTDRGDIDISRRDAKVREGGSSRRSQKKIAEIGGLPRFVLTMHSNSGDIELS